MDAGELTHTEITHLWHIIRHLWNLGVFHSKISITIYGSFYCSKHLFLIYTTSINVLLLSLYTIQLTVLVYRFTHCRVGPLFIRSHASIGMWSNSVDTYISCNMKHTSTVIFTIYSIINCYHHGTELPINAA
jgi:hypothetical protein